MEQTLRRAFLLGVEDGLEKAASAAWREELRKTYGTPQHAPLRKQLIEAGIFNPKEELAKVDRAAEVIAKKLGVRVVPHGKYVAEAEKRFSGAGKVPLLGKKFKERLVARAEKESRGSSYSHAAKEIVTGKKAGPLDKLHEAYESLAMKGEKAPSLLRRIRESPNMTRLIGGKRTDFFTHHDPSVLLRESQALPLLPTNVQSRFRRMRKRSWEAEVFEDAGMKYGRTPRVGKKQFRALSAVTGFGENVVGKLSAGRLARKLVTRGKG